MALTATTLSAALSASALDFNVAAATGATVGGWVQIEQEFAIITAITGTAITVRSRGEAGSQAKAHAASSPVVFLLATDMPAAPPGRSPVKTPRDVTYYAAAGAIALPTNKDAVAVIGKGASGIHAMTLADPSKVAPGLMLFIVSASAYAHTVTLTTGYGGTGDTDVFTLSNVVGSSLTLMSLNGTWAHVSVGRTAAEGASAAVA